MWLITLFKRFFLVGVCTCFIGFMPSVWAENLFKVQPNSLAYFIEKVWRDSPEVQAAEFSIEVVRARVEGADQPLYNPNLVLDAQRSDVNTALVGFNQTLDWSDRGDALRLVANKQFLMAQAALAQVKKSVATDTLMALARYEAVKNMQALELRRTELMRGFIETVKQRQLAGDMGALEVALAQVTYSEALMKQAAMDSQVAEAKAYLQRVTGLVDYAWPALPMALSALPEIVEFVALEQLPELVKLRYQIAVAKAQVLVVESATRVAPTLGVRAGQEGSDTLLGLSLEIPLFVRNDFKAGVRAASYETLVAEQQYQTAYRRAQAQLKGSLERYQNTRYAWNIWLTEGQEAQFEQERVLDKMWQAGELSATDYLIQAKQSIETQKAATELMGEVWQSAIMWLDVSSQLEKWLGLVSSTPVEIQNIGE